MVFLLSVSGSLLAGIVLLFFTNREDLEYLVRDRRRHTHLEGDYQQYHLTTDSEERKGRIWVSHDEHYSISPFGRVRGTSHGHHTKSLDYRVRGTIRRGVMRLRFRNLTAEEMEVMVCYPNLLSSELLVGMWIGKDYDPVWSSGPIILSRRELTAEQLNSFALLNQRILTPRRGIPLISKDPKPSATRTEEDRARLARPLAWVSLVGATLFTATWLLAGLTEPHFSFVNNDTSDLGALTAHHALPYNIGVSVSGILMIALAVALLRLLGRRAAVVFGAFLVAIFGVGAFIDGLAREDCPASVNAVCRAAEKAGRISVHHKVHNAESLVTISALILAPLVLGLVLRSIPSWRRLGWWSIGAAGIQLVCLPLFLTMYNAGSNGQGLVEIIEVTAGVAWIAVVSLGIIRSRPCAVAPA